MRALTIALRIAFFVALAIAIAYSPVATLVQASETSVQTAAWITTGAIVVALLVLRWKGNIGKNIAFT